MWIQTEAEGVAEGANADDEVVGEVTHGLKLPQGCRQAKESIAPYLLCR